MKPSEKMRRLVEMIPILKEIGVEEMTIRGRTGVFTLHLALSHEKILRELHELDKEMESA